MLARGKGVQVTLLSLTKGESGANVITGDYFERLAVLRTLEMRKAAAVYGVELRFGSLSDFGYSKNVEETWRNWDRAHVVAEVAGVIQEVRPHVVIARFTGTPRDGHGHHQASGQAAREAFQQSQDKPWKPLKFYSGSEGQKAGGDWWDPVLGRSYLDIGVEGYRWHRSQGMGGAGPRRGPVTVEYFDDLGESVRPPGQVRKAAEAAMLAWRAQEPKACVPALREGLAAVLAMPRGFERDRLEEKWKRALALAEADGKRAEAVAPIRVGPAVAVEFATRAGVLPLNRSEYRVEVLVRNAGAEAREGTLRLGLPPGWKSEPGVATFRLAQENEEARIGFKVVVPRGEGEATLAAVAESGGQSYSTEYHPVTYRDLDTIYLERPARHLVRRVDVKVAPGVKAGYVMGSGDEVPAAIEKLGVPVEMLDASKLASGDLSRYSIILVGVRAYAVRADLKANNARLLDNVKNGGVLVVQYNTQEFDHNFGPYPYTMTMRAEEVSEEGAPVEILVPGNAVFRGPNAITARDFEGWIEQRGSKFWMTWDERYQPLIETHDTGQAPQKGVWLEARHGNGIYMYCALAWYRQLPFAVPGAYRIFANILSLGAVH